MHYKSSALVFLALIIIAGGSYILLSNSALPSSLSNSISEGTNHIVTESDTTIDPRISAPFSLSEVSNIREIQTATGVTFTKADLERLEAHKFLIKNLLDTKLAYNDGSYALPVGESNREFAALYEKIAGPTDYKERTLGNTVYISSDVLTHLFSTLSVELMKEAENEYLYPELRKSTAALFNAAEKKMNTAKADQEKTDWRKVRDYFAIPHALLSSAVLPLTPEEMMSVQRENADRSLDELQRQKREADTLADSEDSVSAFVRNLKLGRDSEQAVLADIAKIYEASEKEIPQIMFGEFTTIPGDIQFAVPYSLFTVRGSYTSSSLRRQYFRAVQWYQQIPFFTANESLTRYALKIGTLYNETPDVAKQYQSMDALIALLVGKGDDLSITDYAASMQSLGAGREHKTYVADLHERKPAPRIKSLPAFYPSVGIVDMQAVLNATRGMRFFSQRFIPDSYWTGKLTQGDEAPQVNGKKLPLSASSLEVMTILGSRHALDSLPLLPFYAEHKEAIQTRLKELMDEKDTWSESYWFENQHTAILWSIRGMFVWLETHMLQLPAFMQSPLWQAKSLLTASGFWTELRHTNILYAKQSFAEMGAGYEDTCDARKVPPAPMGYVEPQPALYDRLYTTAKKLHATYSKSEMPLKNLEKLEAYINTLALAREYTKLQLEYGRMEEPVQETTVSTEEGPCTTHFIAQSAAVVKRTGDPYAIYAYYPVMEQGHEVAAYSKPEELRLEFARRFVASLPGPVEGPIVPIKDKRAAVTADIHTSEEGILEEATGVPRVIYVAIKDNNGARIAVGLTYSHYEFLSKERLTDEAWQERLYSGENDYLINYKPKSEWPILPAWYKELLGTR